jgi:hypothetical protein
VPNTATVAAAAATLTVGIDSDPAGAAIVFDGRDTRQTTPSSITITGAGPHRLRLSRRGFRALEVELSDTDLKNGSLSYQLQEVEAAPIPVSIAGTYTFEVFDGRRLLSAAAETHELTVAGPRTLRLVAPEYFLDRPVQVEGPAGRRVELRAPDLGKVTIRSALETCQVRIGGRDLGFPPINNQPIASGTYRIDLVCPNGQNQFGAATISPGQTVIVKVP